jgi:hypothetical protein
VEQEIPSGAENAGDIRNVQAEDRIHRVGQPVEIIDDDECIRDFREKRAILDRILAEANEVTDV